MDDAPGAAVATPADTNGLGAATATTADYGRGAALLSAGIGVTGLVTFAFFFVASHALPETEYGRITLLWSTVFIVVTVLYRPVEQLLARTLAEHAAIGATRARRDLRIAATIQLGLGVVFVVAALALRGRIEDELFGGHAALFWIMVVAVLTYALSYFTRGVLAGNKRFGLYGLLVLMEATARVAFPVAAIAGAAGGQTFVALGILAGPVISLAVVPWMVGRRGRALVANTPETAGGGLDREAFGAGGLDRSAAAAAPGDRDEDPKTRVAGQTEFTLAHGAGFAVAALVIMLCEQTFLNAGPLIIKLDAGDAEGAALAGFVFNVLLIARAPLQLFQSISTSLLPHLAGLRAAGGGDTYRRSINLTIAAVAIFATAVAAVMLAAGPFMMGVLFDDNFSYDRFGLVLIALGMGLYLAAATLNQAALAARRTLAAATCWVTCAAAFVAWLLTAPIDDRVLRVEIGFLGAAALLAGSLSLLYRRTRRSGSG